MSASPKIKTGKEQCVDWQLIHRELRYRGTTLRSVWSKYQAQYSYEQFCRYYKHWRNTLNILVRSTHKAGAELFIVHLEFPNLSFHVLDAETGEVHPASLFVAILPASNYCFAEVCVERNIVNWIECHIHAFQFFGGVTQTLVSEPEDCVFTTHVLFRDMLKHYKTRMKITAGQKLQVPALLLRWLSTVLRGKTFLSVAEANTAILNLIDKFHAREFRKVPGSPNEWFASIEKANLKACVNANPLAEISRKQQAQDKSSTFAPAWSPNRVRRWAKAVGPATSHVVATILDHAQNSQRGVCACLGILSLEKECGSERLEAACKRASLQMNWTITSIRHLLEARVDQSFIQLTIPRLTVSAAKLKPRKQRG